MILATDAFNASYANNIEIQEEWKAAQEYINDTIKRGKFCVTIPYRLNHATCALIRQYGYEVSVVEVGTIIRWDCIQWSEKK